jgi:thymidylate synthase
MRSQDAVYGMGNDAPAFSFIHEMMLNVLRQKYPELEYGNYHHFVDSFHAYERHFKMLEQILNDNPTYEVVRCPKIANAAEVAFLRKLEFATIPEEFKFTKWLIA